MAVAPGGRDAERGAGRDERRLERPDERPDQQAARRERDDRVRDELARAVVGHLAAALDADDLDAARGQDRPGRADVRRVGGPAEGQDRRVLEEQELVADARRRRARRRGASGAPAPRGSRPVRAMTRRSAPAPGSTRSARGTSVSIATDRTIAGAGRSPRLADRPSGPDRRPEPERHDRDEAAEPDDERHARSRSRAAASSSRAARRRGSTSRPRPARRGSGCARRVERVRGRSASMTPTVRSAARARNPRTNSGTARRIPRRAESTAPSCAGCPDGRDQEQQRRHQGVADELDHGRHVERARAIRGARRDDLARVVDGDAGPQPERRLRQGDGTTDRRVEEDGERPEQRDRRDRVGDLARARPDDRGRGDDRGVAADRRADGDQDRQPAIDVDDPCQRPGRSRTRRPSSRR